MTTWNDGDGVSTASLEGMHLEVWREEDDEWSLWVSCPGLPDVTAVGCDGERLAKGMAEGIARGLQAPNETRAT